MQSMTKKDQQWSTRFGKALAGTAQLPGDLSCQFRQLRPDLNKDLSIMLTSIQDIIVSWSSSMTELKHETWH